MFCKYEGGEYIPYDEVVRDSKLADVVDIKFESLEEEKCLAFLQKAQWAKMTSLKKMVILDCGVPQYDFSKKSKFKNLEEIEVSMSLMNTETALSLLTAASEITKFSRNQTVFSPIKGPLREKLERKINEIDSCAKSESGSSNSSELSGHAVLSSSIGASSTLRNKESAFRLNRWRENTEEVDDASSISSFEVSIVDETQQHDDVSLSTLSEDEDRESNDLIFEALDLDTIADSPVQSASGFRDSEIICFLGEEHVSKLYSTLNDLELGQVTKIIYKGTGHADNAMQKVAWSKLPSLRDVNIENAAVVGDQLFDDVKFSNLKSINFKNCRIGLSAIERFAGSSSVQLGQFRMDDCLANRGEDREDILKIHEKVNNGRLFSLDVGELKDDEPLDDTAHTTPGHLKTTVQKREQSSSNGDLFRRSSFDSSSSVITSSQDGKRELIDSEDMEEFLDSSTILCYFMGESKPILYSKIIPSDFGKIVGVTYEGLGHADDAMTKLSWAQLTGLRSLHISNALVESDAPLQSQDKKILFPNLVEMIFSKCKLGSKALGGFVARASDNLTKLNMSDCDISKGPESQAIAKLKSKVNNRSQSVSENSNRRDNVGAGAGVGLENDRRGFKGGHNSNGNPARTTKHPTPFLQRNHSGQLGNLSSRQSQTFGTDLSGSRIPGGLGRQSVFSSIPVDRGGTHRKMGSVRDGFSTEFFSMDTNSGHVDHFKSRISRSEMVVENEAAIRDYEKLCDDTEGALEMIKAAVTFGEKNYSCVKIDGEEATRIVYKGTSNTIPILDAYIDTVKVHRGWREVDKNISNKDRALIIIKSLGIPPCPPDIHISKVSTPLGKAIRAEFTRLQQDESEIIVSRIKK